MAELTETPRELADQCIRHPQTAAWEFKIMCCTNGLRAKLAPFPALIGEAVEAR